MVTNNIRLDEGVRGDSCKRIPEDEREYLQFYLLGLCERLEYLDNRYLSVVGTMKSPVNEGPSCVVCKQVSMICGFGD